MPSGWGVYYVVLLSAVLSLGIPATLSFVSFFVTPRRKKREHSLLSAPTAPDLSESEPEVGKRVNTRFFLAANAALILITFPLILVPCVGALQPSEDKSDSFLALVSILTLIGFSALGLLYAARKGDLNWLKTFKKDDSR